MSGEATSPDPAASLGGVLQAMRDMLAAEPGMTMLEWAVHSRTLAELAIDLRALSALSLAPAVADETHTALLEVLAARLALRLARLALIVAGQSAVPAQQGMGGNRQVTPAGAKSAANDYLGSVIAAGEAEERHFGTLLQHVFGPAQAATSN